MADSTGDPQWTIFGVKLKPSAIAENIAASLVIGLAGFILLDFFTAFSNQLGRIMPMPGSATANVIDFTKIAIAVIFTGAFAYHLNRLGLWTTNDAALAALHTRLTAGETAGTWYARTVRSAIFLTDRFFGDAGKARESWQPNAFGLKKAAPLWTEASYSRCLLLAYLYPVTVILIVWLLQNSDGSAEKALGLTKSDSWARASIFVTMTFSTYSLVKSRAINNGKINLRWMFLFIFSIAFVILQWVFNNINLITVLIVYSLIPGFSYKSSEKASIILAFAYVISLYIISNNWDIFLKLLLLLGAVVVFTKLGAKIFTDRSAYIFYVPSAFFGSLLIPYFISNSDSWINIGAYLYFLIVLTFVNSPFDWLALGITRGLLRKGLKKAGFWPLGLGVIDLLISLLTVALLGVAVLIVTQIFNATTVLGGAEELVFDPLPALRNLAAVGQRNQPQYYWLYLMLLTTQIPAILNLGAGFLSVIRTGDFGNMWVLRLMGDRQGVGLWTRGALAAVQAGQFALAMTAGGLLFYLLFIGFVTVEPFAAGNLIDLLLWIAEANWPARLLGVAG